MEGKFYVVGEWFFYSSPSGKNPFPEGLEGIKILSLLNWSDQYINKDSAVLIFDPGNGETLLHYSDLVNKVYTFECDKNNLGRLEKTLKASKKNNISINPSYPGFLANTINIYRSKNDPDEPIIIDYECNSPVNSHEKEEVSVISTDSLNIKDVDLIFFNNDHNISRKVMGMKKTLSDSSFPRIIVKSSNKKTIEKIFGNIGYKIYEIMGSPDFFLFSEHPERNSLEKDIQKINHEKYEKLIVESQLSEIDEKNFKENWLCFKNLNNYKEESIMLPLVKKLLKFCSETRDKKNNFGQEIEKLLNYCLEKNSQEGKFLTEKYLINSHLDFNSRNSLLGKHFNNILKLPIIEKKNVSIKYPEGYLPSSSSLYHRKNGGYLYNIRTVNYSINESGGYIIRDPQSVVRTRNFLLELDENFQILSQKELIDKTEDYGIKKFSSNIVGFEDIRIFSEEDFFCTTLEFVPGRIAQVAWCKFDKKGEVRWIKIPILSNKIKTEKNWAPFLKKGEIHFVYSWGPLSILKMSDKRIELILDAVYSKNNDSFQDFRGSSNLIEYNLRGEKGFLAVVHQVYHDSPRKYFHRFVWLDYDFKNLKYSSLFYFNSVNIEFNVSIASTEKEVYIPHSYRDNTSEISVVSHETISMMLE